MSSLGFFALTVVLVAPGCQFYFDDDPKCRSYDRVDLPPLLNPATLTCEDPYGSSCGEEGDAFERPDIAVDWAICSGACSNLDEATCLQSDGCRAAYTEVGFGDPTGVNLAYGGCFPTAPSGPVRGGDCSALGAYACSLHDDCAAVHDSVPGFFRRCTVEPGACIPSPVPPPPPPIPLRNPETGKCESFGGGGGGGGCDPATGAEVPVPAVPDFGICGSFCETLDEPSCRAADACRAVYANEFPPNADAFHLIYKACWPTAPSGPIRGGTCEGLDAHACSQHDDCVAQHDSDWSGCMDPDHCDWTVGVYLSCAAESAPPPPPPECRTLGEAACVARADCSPLYAGSNCSCSPSGCTCQTWTFDSCEAD